MEVILLRLVQFAKLITIKDIDIPKVEYKAGENGIFSSVLSVVFGVAGGVALIIIIVAGIKFMTSQGEPQAIAKARNTIIYALIGLVICIAAFSIVNFTSRQLG